MVLTTLDNYPSETETDRTSERVKWNAAAVVSLDGMNECEQQQQQQSHTAGGSW